MPMNDQQRRASLQRAGVSQQQIDEFVGELPINEDTIRAHGVAAGQAQQVRTAVRQVLADAAIIAAKYGVAQGAAAVDPGEVETDRVHLNELFADEYTLTDPFGQAHDKAELIEGMLRGTISYDGMGRAGFQALRQSLNVYGNTAVVVSDHRLQARGRARNTQTGQISRQNLNGTYRITNHYVLRDNRWQAASSQMTQVPRERRFVLTHEG